MKKLGFGKIARILPLLCVVSAISAPAQAFKPLLNFNGTDGEFPKGSLVQATDGSFYGTSWGNRGGEVFKMTPAGKLTILHHFCSSNSQAKCTDGEAPFAGLVQAANGNFYGTRPCSAGLTRLAPFLKSRHTAS
jgi:hypothetical protein